MSLQTFIDALPKAELHVHHVGSAFPGIVSTLAERHPDGPVPSDPEALSRFGGPEIGVGRPQLKPHFDAARATALHAVPHAGETTGPETVWEALRDLGAERIGHGTSAAHDPALLAHLVAEGIPLEVCSSSNIATRAVVRTSFLDQQGKSVLLAEIDAYVG